MQEVLLHCLVERQEGQQLARRVRAAAGLQRFPNPVVSAMGRGFVLLVRCLACDRLGLMVVGAISVEGDYGHKLFHFRQ